jgi:hypothetical protein
VYLGQVDGERLFDQAAALTQQSRRLRADLWTYRALVERALGQAGAEPLEVPRSLELFGDYFLETSFNFLRYGDGGPFERFQAILADGRQRGQTHGPWRQRFLEDATRFRDFLSETFDSVCRRTELQAAPPELEAFARGLEAWLREPVPGPASG